MKFIQQVGNLEKGADRNRQEKKTLAVKKQTVSKTAQDRGQKHAGFLIRKGFWL